MIQRTYACECDSILRTLTRKTPLGAGVDVAEIGESGRCNGFSGADLASLVREACVAALKGNLAEATRADTEREKARLAGGHVAEAAAALPAPPPPVVGHGAIHSHTHHRLWAALQ